MGIAEVECVATAAVRDAEDGPEFVTEVKRLCGLDVRVLSGTEGGRAIGSRRPRRHARGRRRDGRPRRRQSGIGASPERHGARSRDLAARPVAPGRGMRRQQEACPRDYRSSARRSEVARSRAGHRALSCRRQLAGPGAGPYGADQLSAQGHSSLPFEAGRDQRSGRLGGGAKPRIAGPPRGRVTAARRSLAARCPGDEPVTQNSGADRRRVLRLRPARRHAVRAAISG